MSDGEEVVGQQSDDHQGWSSDNKWSDFEADFRAASNFLSTADEAKRRQVELDFERRATSRWRRKWIRQMDDGGRQARKCTQFRVDIRETIICDKRRCDKFDFEWPKHDNQIVHVESTRHGMRFYRAEYAFASETAAATATEPLQGRRRETMRPSATGGGGRREQAIAAAKAPEANGQNSDRVKPIKFDLFDLFKPKPTSTTPVPPVTNALPSTLAPDTTKASTPKQEEEEEANNKTTTTIAPTITTPEAETKATTTVASESPTRNSTRLVTTLRVNTKLPRQTMLGFGGALSDATCRNIKSLSAKMAKSLMEDYYGERGLRYNLARMTMGSSDFSPTPYTNNDRKAAPTTSNTEQREAADKWLRDQASILSDDDDVEMKRFRLVDEDFEFKLPVARQAIATSRQEIKFFSSLWSPPIWMKNNSHIVHGWLKGDIYGPYYKALADYIVRWLEAYRKQGLEFWATTALNEPMTGIKPFIFHNSLGITREDYVTFLKLYLGPMMRQRGFANVKLIMLDDNKGYAPQLVKLVLGDPEAAKFVAGIGVHWYMNDEYENLNFIERDHPDKFLLSTEASNGYLPFQVHTLPGNWDRGVAYMYDMIKVIQKQAAGWVDWNMALDLDGGPSWAKNNLDAPIIVNSDRDEYYKSPAFYAIGHFSKFVEPNSTRLDHRLANARYNRPLEAVAFYTPRDYVVIVALNTNKHPVPFRIIVDQQLVRVVTLRDESFNTIIFKWKR